MKALDHIAGTEGRALFVLRDFHPFLNDPTVVRKLRDLAHELRKTQKNLHPALAGDEDSARAREGDRAIIDWDLPDRGEIERHRRQAAAGAARRRRSR